jgi:hypothetical protein
MSEKPKGRPDSGWTPRLLQRGRVYCSPLCGHMCSRKDYDEAVAAASKLAILLGAGWRGRVWENMGWHYEVTKGVCEISAHTSGGRTTYSFYFNGAVRIGLVNSKHTNPKALFAAGMQKVDELISGLALQALQARKGGPLPDSVSLVAIPGKKAA